MAEKLEKTSLYLLAIVAIVAVVGIVVLILNSSGSGGGSFLTNDISGYATAVTCGDGTCVKPENLINCPTDCKGIKKDTDGDGVSDKKDVCSGYDDNVDTDGDGTPDGCDDDDDGDGYSDADETTAGTDSLDASDYPASYPDLTHDEASTAATTFDVTGYVLDSGQLVALNYESGDFTCGMINQGSVTASGYSYSECYLYLGDELGVIGRGRYDYRTPLELDSGEISTWSGSGYSGSAKGWYTSGESYVSFFQNIYDTGSTEIDVIVKYDIDYATTKYITESDETNNEGEVELTVSLTANWVEVGCLDDSHCSETAYCADDDTCVEAECTSDSDCASGCGCSTSDYTCYESTTSGSSTYLTTTDCTS